MKDELTLHGHCRELALARLAATAVGEYLTRRFPADHAFDALAGMIHARTGGNPLFVVNVADDLVRRAVLVEHAGRWEVEELPGPAQIAVPEDVRRMIGRQLDRLRPDERRILEAASAAGVEFSGAAVAAAEQIGLDDVERACADLAEWATFLIAHGAETWPDGTVAGRYGFRHALYQEVVYETTPAARRADLLAAIRALGSEEFKTYFLGLLAATLAKAGEHSAALEVVTEALGAVERRGERFYAAELHRQQGEFLLATGHDLADAIRCFESALEIARHQRAWALEQRARRALDSAVSRTS